MTGLDMYGTKCPLCDQGWMADDGPNWLRCYVCDHRMYRYEGSRTMNYYVPERDRGRGCFLFFLFALILGYTVFWTGLGFFLGFLVYRH